MASFQAKQEEDKGNIRELFSLYFSLKLCHFVNHLFLIYYIWVRKQTIDIAYILLNHEKYNDVNKLKLCSNLIFHKPYRIVYFKNCEKFHENEAEIIHEIYLKIHIE